MTRFHGLARALCVGLVALPVTAATVTATWTAAGDGLNYSNAANWDIAIVPLNDPNTQYNVVIGTNRNVRFDIDDPGTVQDFTLGAGSTFTVSPGHALTVADDSSIAGWIKVDNSAFTSVMPGAAFGGNTARIEALGGGDVALAATTLSSTGFVTCCTAINLLVADGAGSTIDLGSLQSLNAGFNDVNTGTLVQRVSATNSASINRSSLQTVTGPVRVEDYVEFVIKTGASIDLSALQTINSAGQGHTRFNIDVPTFGLPSLIEANRVRFDLFTNSSWSFLALSSLQNAQINLSNGATLSMPGVVETSGGTWTWPTPGPTRAITTIDVPNLVAMDGVTLNLDSDGVLNAPQLGSFTASRVALAPGRTFTVAPFVNIDNSRIAISGGMSWAGLAPTTTGYTSTSLNGCCGEYELFAASGPGTLDLSPLTQINAGFHDANTGVTAHRIRALAGGVIDLSNLNTVVAPVRAEDSLEFVTGSGGAILLPSLANVSSAGSGTVRFIAQDATSLTLPALISLDRVVFDLAPGSSLTIPAVTAISNATLNVPVSGSVTAWSLGSADGVNVVFAGSDGVLTAPALTSFTSSRIELGAGNVFNSSLLANIANSRFAVSDGATFAGLAPTTTSYTSTGLNGCCGTVELFKASGASVLDLSPLAHINAAFHDVNSGVLVHRIEALAGGTINLSNVTSISSPVRAEDRVDIVANTNSTIDLGNLQSITGTGLTRFIVESQGLLKLGDLSSTQRTSFSLTDVSSRLIMGGSLLLATDATMSCAAGAELTIGGNFSFRTQVEANMNAQSGILHFDRPGLKYLEVGGLDVGVPTNEATLNFGVGQLVVGDPNVTTVVQLLDVIDNGNRGPTTAEALYLYGLGGPDGLRILGGSTLRLNNIRVYAKLGGVWTLLSDLFPQGSVEIPFDDGFIRRDAGTEIVGDCNCDGVVNFDDIDAFVLALSDPAGYDATYPNCYRLLADCDGNRAVDFDDIDPFVAVLSQ